MTAMWENRWMTKDASRKIYGRDHNDIWAEDTDSNKEVLQSEYFRNLERLRCQLSAIYAVLDGCRQVGK